MTNMQITGLTANTQYEIKLLRPSAIDSPDADYLVATTSCVSDGSGTLTVALVPTTGTLYYYGVFGTNSYAFLVPDSANTLQITANLTTPEKSVVQYASVTSVNGKTGVVSLSMADLTGQSVNEVNGKTGIVTLGASDVGAVPNGATVNGKLLTSDPVLAASDVGALPSTYTPAVSKLSDVSLTGLVSGDVLSYNGTDWVPESLIGSVLALTYLTSDVEGTATTQTTSGGTQIKVPVYNGSYYTTSFVAPASGRVKITVKVLATFDLSTAGSLSKLLADLILCSDTSGTLLGSASETGTANILWKESTSFDTNIYAPICASMIIPNLTAGQTYNVYLGMGIEAVGTVAGDTVSFSYLGGPAVYSNTNPGETESFILVEAL